MLINNNVTVNKFYIESKYRTFIGFLPVQDVERHNYYTVENIHPDSEYKRVSPVMGMNSPFPYCSEEYFVDKDLIKKENFKRTGLRGSYEEYVKKYYEVKDNIKNNPYLLIFVGCDDGDIAMRFPDLTAALNYIQNEIVYFDEVYFDKKSLRIH